MMIEKPIIPKIEKSFRNFATQQDIPILGSYDPNCIGCSADDFYDGMHLKSTYMRKVFSNWTGSLDPMNRSKGRATYRVTYQCKPAKDNK